MSPYWCTQFDNNGITSTVKALITAKNGNQQINNCQNGGYWLYNGHDLNIGCGNHDSACTTTDGSAIECAGGTSYGSAAQQIRKIKDKVYTFASNAGLNSKKCPQPEDGWIFTLRKQDGDLVSRTRCDRACADHANCNYYVYWDHPGTGFCVGCEPEPAIHHAGLQTYQKGVTVGYSEAGGDPHVTNLAGEKFDILQVGAFDLLSLNHKSTLPQILNPLREWLLQIKIFVTETDPTNCLEKYIQNATLTGSWVRHMGYDKIDIRANPFSLEVGLNGKWQNVSNLTPGPLTSNDLKLLDVQFPNLQLRVDIENFHKASKNDWQKATRPLGWSFLNLRFRGLQDLDKDFSIHGLLGDDDHTYAASKPQGCKMPQDMHAEMESRSTLLPFLSTISVE